MNVKNLYLFMSVIGLFAPLSVFVPWLNVHGMDWGLMGDLLMANQITQATLIDLSLAALVALIFMVAEGLRARVPLWWIAPIGTCTIGLCFGLPLFLYLRERAQTS